MRFFRGTHVLAAALALVPGWAFAQHEHDHVHVAPEKFGQVHFLTSCKAQVQPVFERGLALLHSFAYGMVATVLEGVSAKDPGCGMAQWGIAMSYFHTIWGPPTEDEFAAGRTAAQKAASIGAPSARERDYIGAIGAYYQGDGVAHPARVVAFEKAMAGVAERNPGDHEAAIFKALAILGVAYNSPPDKTYARQKEAAEILNRMLALEPEHPGIAHYMIHSFDYPELAALALPAARAYAKLAPSAPHALHMPSHIFTRLGMWKESIDSNLASARTAQEWVARPHPLLRRPRGGEIRVDRLLPHSQPGEDVRGHVQRMRGRGRDCGVGAGRGQRQRGQLGVVEGVDHVVGDPRMLGFQREHAIEDLRRLLLPRVGL